MGCLIMSLMLGILTVKFWPPPSGETEVLPVYSTRGQELIKIEEVVQTEQHVRKPPPPSPQIPILVPDDVVLDDLDLDISDNLLDIEDYGTDEDVEVGDRLAENEALVSAQVAPKPVRIVEPEYTQSARKKKVRAEVVIEVLVNDRGRVEQAKIIDRYLLGKKKEDPKVRVDQLGFGLEEAALLAAEGWMFRPARHRGKPVNSYFTFTLSFGI